MTDQASLVILGRQPAIGLAELESLYGADKLQPIGDQAVLLALKPDQIEFTRLGGMVKLAKVLTEIPATSWKDIEKYLLQNVPEHLDYLPEGKLKLGLSVYGLPVPVKQIGASGLKLKKAITAAGRSCRVVPNDEPTLNSAKILHNNLNGPLGWELLLVKNGSYTVLAQTIAVQDIEAYAARDQARPQRDAKVGMLPPKLAQIIVNMAVGPASASDPQCGPGENRGQTILDPFCGTGVILQEAALMGYNVYGTDIDRRMIDYTKANLDWLGETWRHPPFSYRVEVADATGYLWPQDSHAVASEVYLGRPFTTVPSPDTLKEVAQDTNQIIKKFLKNLVTQTKPGFRLCLALPAWQANTAGQGFIRLPLLDQLTEMGYNRLSFVHAKNEALIYHRKGQVVGRELVVLIRK